MSKKDDFITVVKRVKSALSNITDDQRKKLLTQARQDHGLMSEEATKILQDEGLTVNNVVNYFEELKLDIKHIKGLNDKDIKELITKQFTELDRKYQGDANPRITRKRERLEKAKKILLNPKTRTEHRDLIHKNGLRPKHVVDLLFTFATTTSIPQLATLMESNANETTDILYSGDLERCLLGTGFDRATRSVRSEFPSNKSMGRMAIVAILRGKVKLKSGDEAGTPRELARLIDKNDKNWADAKILLYNGFLALWLEYTKEQQFASTVRSIINDHGDDQDIGLEKLVKKLNPQIRNPVLEISQSEIDFGTVSKNSKNQVSIKIRNNGRGFLHGDVQLEKSMPGLKISGVEIRGEGAVTIELDARALPSKKTHKTSLEVKTNGGSLNVPISCYVDNPVQQSVQRVAVSGLSVAAIALVARLIIQQFGSSGWLATRLTGAGFTEWEHHWRWVEWFEWPWFEWKVYTLSAPGSGLGFVIALISIGAGIFGYWYFFFKKKSVR